jgi:D-alanyl-D-alanine dipeptidase
MPSFAWVLCALLIGTGSACAAPRRGPTQPLAGARQLVVVVTDEWSARAGTLRRFVRDGSTDSWRALPGEAPVMVGSAGLGWGRGLHPPQSSGPTKQEGDRRAPAGVFRLSATFGYESSAPGKLPYTPLGESIQCVDDPRSKKYNLLVDRSGISNPDWKHFEVMRRDDDQYRIGVVVDHNAWPATPGAGSCIFLHIWAAPDQPTVGCTAMAPANVEELAGWLDPSAHPALVQLPRREYQRLREEWALP